MFVYTITAGATNTIIEYDSKDYILFSDRTAGTEFYKEGEDVTSSVSNISTGSFPNQVIIQGDQTDVIVDDEKNTYYCVLIYTTTQNTRPDRS